MPRSISRIRFVKTSPMFADCDEVTYMSMICVIVLEVGSEGKHVGSECMGS